MTEDDVEWDVLAFRQWAAQRWPARAKFIRDGELDFDYFADAFRAGAAASADRIKELEARVAELEAALRPSIWVGPTGIDISFSAPGRPNATSLPGTVGGSGGYSQSTSTPVDDSGRTDTEVKEDDQ